MSNEYKAEVLAKSIMHNFGVDICDDTIKFEVDAMSNTVFVKNIKHGVNIEIEFNFSLQEILYFGVFDNGSNIDSCDITTLFSVECVTFIDILMHVDNVKRHIK